ncbi:oligosaccharide repeat unit polymerase [Aeromonas caviae]|uniref:oligosaccharide repeat unit polymerase n=1 Tax=Aeromonas caviae TaxID=648 RepID=UPI002B4A778E|nr:oligosaccharide repeat unit polymerase [Aeromonas caviae]
MMPLERGLVNIIKRHLSSLYIIANIFCALAFSATGYLGGDFSGRNISSNTMSLFLSLIIILSSIYMYQKLIYNYLSKIEVPTFAYVSNLILDAVVSLLMILSIVGALFYNIGVVGVGANGAESSALVKLMAYIFSIFQPTWFSLIYIYYRVSAHYSRWLYINVLLYTILILFTGQSIQLIALLYVYLAMYCHKSNSLPSWRLVLLSIIGFLVYPLIRFLKYAIIGSSAYDIEVSMMMGNALSDTSISELYKDMLFVALERFQFVANTSYIMNFSHTISNGYTPSMLSYFSGYWVIDSLAKAIGVHVNFIVPPQEYLATMISGMDNWSSHIGLYGYSVFFGEESFFIYLISVAILCISVLVSKVIFKSHFFLVLPWAISFILIIHGWLIQYMAFLQAQFIFLIVIILVKILRKIFHPHNS